MDEARFSVTFNRKAIFNRPTQFKSYSARLGLILGLNVNIQLQSVAFVTTKIRKLDRKLVSDQDLIIFWEKEG